MVKIVESDGPIWPAEHHSVQDTPVRNQPQKALIVVERWPGDIA